MTSELNENLYDMVEKLIHFRWQSNHDLIGQANKVTFYIQPQTTYKSQLLFDFKPIYNILHLTLIFIVCLLVFRVCKIILSIANKNYWGVVL